MRALVPVREPSGETVEVGWPGELPAPVLDGPTATYPDVTPGVDLQVQATTVGYETFMVLAERSAAGREVSWTLPLTLDGVQAVETDQGGVQFRSTGDVEGGAPAGEVVSELAPAHAWDAAYDEAAQTHTNYSDVALEVVEVPGGGVGVKVTPDQAWLQDPTTVFPVTVDPTYASGSQSITKDTYVQSDTGSAVHGGKDELRVGTYDGSAVARTYLALGSGNFVGKTIMYAEVSLYATYSYSCNARGWEAYDAGDFSETTTTWSNRPAFGSTLRGSSSMTKGYSSSCAAGRVSVPITALAQAWSGQTGVFPLFWTPD